MLSGDEILKLEEFYHIFSFEPNFQVVAKLDGMRFIIHPNENCGHNNGHIHIESSGAEIEIDLRMNIVIQSLSLISCVII